MLKESSNSKVVRVFMHRDFDGVMMVKFNDEPIHTVERLADAELMFDVHSELSGVNLLSEAYDSHGYMNLDESLKKYVEERLSSLNIHIEIDQRSYFVSGRIKKLEEHPLSEHLHVCTVDVGEKDLRIVCGAKNVMEDMLVVVALPNAILPDGTLISNGKVAGVASQGMLCSLSDITGKKQPVHGLIELPKGTECGSVLDIAGLGETLC
jgi:tRNA-binding protein